jgi:hypothetical protein
MLGRFLQFSKSSSTAQAPDSNMAPAYDREEQTIAIEGIKCYGLLPICTVNATRNGVIFWVRMPKPKIRHSAALRAPSPTRKRLVSF